MLRFIRQGQRWIVTALVAMVGLVFVFFFGPWDFTQTQGNASVPVEVDGIQYTMEDFRRTRALLEQRLRESLGDQYEGSAVEAQLDGLAMDRLVQRAIMESEARRLGLAASDAEVNRLIRQTFSDFRDAQGNLDEEAARRAVQYEWGTVREFKEAVRADLAVQKLGRLLRATAGVSEAEAREALRYRQEEVRIAFVALGPDQAPDAEAIPEGEVDEFRRSHPERIRAYYDENLERWARPERIRLRHVLIQVPLGADEAAVARARERAEAARERIAAGEDMASVAREVSEDEGSGEQGGDLGLLPRDELSAELRRAAEALEEGALSEVVRTEQGFHVLRVEARRPAETLPLESVASEIARELMAQERVERWVEATRADLEAALAEGQTLEEAARALRLDIERTAFFRRRPDGFVRGLGDSMEAQTVAFALTPEAPVWPEPIEVGPRTVFIQLLERRAPEPDEIASQLEAERERILERARQQVEAMWIEARREALARQGRIRTDASALP